MLLDTDRPDGPRRPGGNQNIMLGGRHRPAARQPSLEQIFVLLKDNHTLLLDLKERLERLENHK